MKKMKYLLLMLLVSLSFAACNDDDEDEITDETAKAGAAFVNLTVVDDATGFPISGVSVKQNLMKISATTDEDGGTTLAFNEAPRAIANLVFSHDNYDSYTTTIPVGEVVDGNLKVIDQQIRLTQKSIHYVITFTVLDDSTYLPLEGVSVLGLETGADDSNIDGVVKLNVAAPGDYKLKLALAEYDTLELPTVTMPDEGEPGETITVDQGIIYMSLAKGFQIKEVDLAEMTWKLDSTHMEQRPEKGGTGSEIWSKEQYLTDFVGEQVAAGPNDYAERFNELDFDYAIAASGNNWIYPLLFKIHYEEATYAPGCYRVEVIAYMEPFGDLDNQGASKVYEDLSYYDYKKKKLVFHFDFYEGWCQQRGWDTFIFSEKQ